MAVMVALRSQLWCVAVQTSARSNVQKCFIVIALRGVVLSDALQCRPEITILSPLRLPVPPSRRYEIQSPAQATDTLSGAL